MRFPLAVALCCALLAALVALVALAAGWPSVRADESNGAESQAALLEVTFYADAPVCTAGSMMAVHWEIRGGVEPYQAMLNGEPADASSNSAPVPCGPAYDIPAWLYGGRLRSRLRRLQLEHPCIRAEPQLFVRIIINLTYGEPEPVVIQVVGTVRVAPQIVLFSQVLCLVEMHPGRGASRSIRIVRPLIVTPALFVPPGEMPVGP